MARSVLQSCVVVFSAECLVFGVWCLEFRVSRLVFGVWCPAFDDWRLMFGAGCLVSCVSCCVLRVL